MAWRAWCLLMAPVLVSCHRREDDSLQMLQQPWAKAQEHKAAALLEGSTLKRQGKKELAQLLADAKTACLSASQDCLPLLGQYREGIWPLLQATIGNYSLWEPREFRGDVVSANLKEQCNGANHTMIFMHIWKSAGFALIRNVRRLSEDFIRVRLNKTFCHEMHRIDPQRRSTFTFVREPLQRFVSGYAEIEKWAESWHYSWLTQYPKGSTQRATRFLERFFADGVNSNGHVKPQAEYLAPTEEGCPMPMDFIGRTERIEEDWDTFMKSKKCAESPFNNALGQHPTKDDDRLAMNQGLGLSFVEAQSTLESSAAAQQMRSVLMQNKTYLQAFCYFSLPDYVAFDYDLPEECRSPELLDIVSLAKKAPPAKAKPAKPTAFLSRPCGGGGDCQPKSLLQTDGPKVFVGLPSGHAERRQIWREKWHCGEKLRKAGIPYVFVVGWPVQRGRDLTKHSQGLQASEEEAQMAEALRKENEKYGDMHFIAVPDTYLDLQAKTFAIMEYGYNQGASYVVKLDDDNCMDPEKLSQGIEKHEKEHNGTALYGGYYAWKGTEYAGMKGRDKQSHPYMSGPGYVLSRDLIQKIIKDDEPNSVLWASYGSFDEDAQTGRWVDYAAKHHDLKVNFMEIKGLLEKHPEDS